MSDNKSDKKNQFGDLQENAPRARNRTVMLTPDITTQVRERLSKKMGFEEQPVPENDILEQFSNLEESSADSISLPFHASPEEVFEQEVQQASEEMQDFDQPAYSEELAYEQKFQIDSDKSINPISRQVFKVNSEEVQRSEPVAPESQDNDSELDAFDTPTQAETPAQELAPQRRVIPVTPETAKRKTLSFNSAELLDLRQESQSMKEDLGNIKVSWAKVTPIVGFFVSFDEDPNGEVLALRSGRLLVSSEKPTTGSFVVIKDESVSPMHAILRITEEGQIQILDNLSEHGTTIIRAQDGEELKLSGEKALLNHRDIVQIGARSFKVCIL
jgi:hypothetical protein